MSCLGLFFVKLKALTSSELQKSSWEKGLMHFKFAGQTYLLPISKCVLFESQKQKERKTIVKKSIISKSDSISMGSLKQRGHMNMVVRNKIKVSI